MDDIDIKPTIEKLEEKCIDNYHSCYIYSGCIDELENNVHLYISGNNDRGHLSTTIDHVKLIHKLLSEFIKRYDKEQERIDSERVILTNCLDCKEHRKIKDPDPNDWDSNKISVLCSLTDNNTMNRGSKWASDLSGFKSIIRCCNQDNIRRSTNVPEWCPIGYYKYIKKNQ